MKYVAGLRYFRVIGTCEGTGKASYPSERSATTAMKRLRENGEYGLEPYFCKACHGWHLGH